MLSQKLRIYRLTVYPFFLFTVSTQKSAVGAELAETTAKSFAQIVDGIGISNEIITKIAKASHNQDDCISSMKREMDAVSSVVETTGSAAEEYSAAAEEMNGQSSQLKEMIGHFKLRDRGII